MPISVIIQSDDDAFRWLKDTVDNMKLPDGLGPENFEFENWPGLTIRLTGEKFHDSLTPNVMRGFVDLQNAIYKSYAIAKYGIPDVRKLTDQEKEEVEIVVKVKDGSSVLEIDIQGLLEKFIESAAGKMDPIHIVIIMLGLGVVWGGNTAYRAYLSSQQARRQAELSTDEAKAALLNMQELSKQETERIKIITDAMKKEPILINIDRQAYDGKTDLIKRLAQADTIEFIGEDGVASINITGEIAGELVKNARRKSGRVRLDGLYRILRVDTTDSTQFRVRLAAKAYDIQFEAVVKDSILLPEARRALQDAEWSRQFVRLIIDARDLDGDIRDAVVSSIEPEQYDGN